MASRRSAKSEAVSQRAIVALSILLWMIARADWRALMDRAPWCGWPRHMRPKRFRWNPAHTALLFGTGQPKHSAARLLQNGRRTHFVIFPLDIPRRKNI